MGIFYYVTCRNCGYQKEVREGPGMIGFARIYTLEKKFKDGEIDAPDDFKRLLDLGYHLRSKATYLCPKCKKWVVKDDIYIRELLHVSPYGTIREYKMHYLNGVPKCDDCNTELIDILNPRSSKTKCPKCGCNNMKSSHTGYID